MKLLILLATLTLSTMVHNGFYEVKINDINGEPFNMGSLVGQWVLVVNVASECGYTSQYEELQKLHETLGDKVAVIGVPSNDFGGQEPGSGEEIASFCKKNYGVTFPILEKVKIKGDDPHPLYQWLTQKEKNDSKNSTVKWNFHKYLVAPNGHLIENFPSKISPMSEEILSYIK